MARQIKWAIWIQSKLQKINDKMQERKREIILQNIVERAQAIEIKKSQFYLLFGYSTEKLKVTSATKQ